MLKINNREKLKRILTFAVIGLVLLLILAQLVPIQRDNPATTREIKWDSPQTRALAQRACFDCHSNETVWPWYATIAPFSWRLASHVYEGRRSLDFSEWDRPNENQRRIIDEIATGRMPLWDYLLIHPEAKLTQAEQKALIDGLEKTLASDPPIERQRRREG